MGSKGGREGGRGRLKHQKRSGVRAGKIAGLTDAADTWGEKERTDRGNKCVTVNWK